MHSPVRLIPHRPLDRRLSFLAVGTACLLIIIRLIAAVVCAACFYDFEEPQRRSFHLHTDGDRSPCHNGRVEVDPVTAWACQVNKDEPACVLPEIPRLPVLVSFFVPLILLMWSYPGRPLVAAHGRGPPFLVH